MIQTTDDEMSFFLYTQQQWKMAVEACNNGEYHQCEVYRYDMT